MGLLRLILLYLLAIPTNLVWVVTAAAGQIYNYGDAAVHSELQRHTYDDSENNIRLKNWPQPVSQRRNQAAFLPCLIVYLLDLTKSEVQKMAEQCATR